MALALASLATFSGCKDSLRGRTKSLDNFASQDGTIRKNSCTADPEAVVELTKILPQKPRIEYGTVPRDEFHKVLAAVPSSLVTAFFMFGGKIYLTPEKSSICTSTNANSTDYQQAQSEGKNEVRSACWAPGTDGGIDLWIDPRKSQGVYEEIHHGTVRAFGHMFAEIFLKFRFEQRELANQSNGSKAYYWQATKSADERELDYLRKLAKTFEEEVALKQQIAKKQGGMSAQENGEQQLYDLSRYDDIRQGEKRQLFEYFVFGEAFDSYFCSAETREAMKQEFPSTHASMEVVSESFSNDSGRTYGPVSYSPKRYQSCLIGCEIQKMVSGIPLTVERRPDLDTFYDQQQVQPEQDWERNQGSASNYPGYGRPNSGVDNRGNQLPSNLPENMNPSEIDIQESQGYGPSNFVTLPASPATGGGPSMFGSILAQAGGLFIQNLAMRRQDAAAAQARAANTIATAGQPMPVGTGTTAIGTSPYNSTYNQNPAYSGSSVPNSTAPTYTPPQSSAPYQQQELAPPVPIQKKPVAKKKSSSSCGVVGTSTNAMQTLWMLIPLLFVQARVKRTKRS